MLALLDLHPGASNCLRAISACACFQLPSQHYPSPLLLQLPAPALGAPDSWVADVAVHPRPGVRPAVEVRVAVVGNVDSGKSTMVSAAQHAKRSTLPCTPVLRPACLHLSACLHACACAAAEAPIIPPTSPPNSISPARQVGVLTRSMLDDGRGLARAKVFKHSHEESTGAQEGAGVGVEGLVGAWWGRRKQGRECMCGLGQATNGLRDGIVCE